ncbi:hypothetical protein PISMIDRAFT_175694 [Pisolithus microcarpus 441]|uniref:Magnesium transporter n=1 Tax=Pisolithus microcarpus 441 TaxID=765257 RepID=A0A0C9ZFS5_9AGAM|nr:hypothetical protein PISMIDRAFT_175694 [Pisolithus microcarpus 441]
MQVDTLRRRASVPPYRYTAHSTPWPWIDPDVDDSEIFFPDGFMFSMNSWKKYPQNLPKDLDWAPDQVRRSRILTGCAHSQICSIHIVDVSKDGHYNKASGDGTITVTADNISAQAFWKTLQQPLPDDVRIRAIFVENLSLHVIQILGTVYKIAPSFFSSLVNSIPSRYREDVGHEDHITVVLPFVGTMRKPGPGPTSDSGLSFDEAQDTDPQAPLDLGDTVIFQDLLAVYMVRSRTYSNIISCHPVSNLDTVSGNHLQSFVQRTWGDIHRSKTFMNSKDPISHLLDILYYALYAWEEVCEVLTRYVENLETGASKTGTIRSLAAKCHEMQTHLIHYQQLIQEFHASVEFVKWAPKPTTETEIEGGEFAKLKADNLLYGLRQLQYQITMLSNRLRNTTALALVTTRMEESRALQILTEESLRDSANVKLLAYFIMIFFPGILMAKVFGMNVVEFSLGSHETLAHFAGATIALTVMTVSLAIALQRWTRFRPVGSPLW